MMPPDEEGWRENAQAFGDFYASQWREFRKQINMSINLLSNEVFALQKRFDKDDESRSVRQKHNDRFLWGLVVAVAALGIVNLLALAYFVGAR